MRISDWSSDVCSSDLIEFTLYWGGRTRADLYLHEEVEAWVREHPNFRYVPVHSEPTDDCQWSGRTDRKSVVEGKSESVRVDLGGGRIIKKNKTYRDHELST